MKPDYNVIATVGKKTKKKGIFFAGIVGFILLIMFRKSGKFEIPFVPFLFLAWIIIQVIHLAGGV